MPSSLPVSLPFAVVFRDIVVAPGEEEGLLPLLGREPDRIQKAVEKRRREYRAGRHVARQVLGELGLPHGPLIADRDGVPRYPAGVSVSLSHTGSRVTYAAAIATRETSWLGLDVEEIKPLDEGVVERIVTPKERDELAPLLASEDGAIACFSCKEAIYKCVFPHHRRMLGFHDVCLSGSGEGSFCVQIPSLADLPPISVSFVKVAGRILSVAHASVDP